MQYIARHLRGGFTIVEVLIVIVVIGILATITVVTYGGVQRRAASVSAQDAAKDAAEMVDVEKAMGRTLPASLPATFKAPDGVEMRYTTDTFVRYSNLTPVQNGVLFYETCKQLIVDPYYTTIHAKDGSRTDTVLARCDATLNKTTLQITGWLSKSWSTPVSLAQIESFKASIPYDSWWTDKQKVIRDFYTELANRYVRQGGTWPITSFYDSWATPGNGGVMREELPSVTSDMNVESYCIQVTHQKYPNMSYFVTPSVKSPQEGVCA